MSGTSSAGATHEVVATLLFAWVEAVGSPFDDDDDDASEREHVHGYLTVPQIVEKLHVVIEDGDVEHDGEELSEEGVSAALEDLAAQQRKGEPLGILRRKARDGTWLWRLNPPDETTAAARAGGRTVSSERLQAVLFEMMDLETVASATAVVAALLDAAGDELVSLRPVLEALAAASVLDVPSGTQRLDMQVLLTAADDALSDAQQTHVERLVRTAGAGARAGAGASTTARRDPARNSPAGRAKRQRRSSEPTEHARNVQQHDAELSGELIEVVRLILAETLKRLLEPQSDEEALQTLRAERAALTTFACTELTTLQRVRSAARRRLDSTSARAIREGVSSLQEVHLAHFGPIVEGRSLHFDGDAFLRQCQRDSPVVTRLWRSFVTPHDGRAKGGWRRKFLRSIFVQGAIFRIARTHEPLARTPTAVLYASMHELFGASRNVARLNASVGLAPYPDLMDAFTDRQHEVAAQVMLTALVDLARWRERFLVWLTDGGSSLLPQQAAMSD